LGLHGTGAVRAKGIREQVAIRGAIDIGGPFLMERGVKRDGEFGGRGVGAQRFEGKIFMFQLIGVGHLPDAVLALLEFILVGGRFRRGFGLVPLGGFAGSVGIPERAPALAGGEEGTRGGGGGEEGRQGLGGGIADGHVPLFVDMDDFPRLRDIEAFDRGSRIRTAIGADRMGAKKDGSVLGNIQQIDRLLFRFDIEGQVASPDADGGSAGFDLEPFGIQVGDFSRDDPEEAGGEVKGAPGAGSAGLIEVIIDRQFAVFAEGEDGLVGEEDMESGAGRGFQGILGEYGGLEGKGAGGTIRSGGGGRSLEIPDLTDGGERDGGAVFGGPGGLEGARIRFPKGFPEQPAGDNDGGQKQAGDQPARNGCG